MSEKVVKNGVTRGKQRYMCRGCGCIFVEGDQWTNDGVIAKKVMCTIFYSVGKVLFSMLAHVFDDWSFLVYCWIVEAGAKLSESEVCGEIKEMRV